MNTTRREFLQKSALAMAMPAIIPARALGRDGAVAPSNRIVLGAIGIGPRGRLVLDAFLKQPDAQFVTVCDVQAANRRTAKMMVDRKNGNQDCGTTGDLLEVLGRDDIDAVLIATGDRWHAVATMFAAKAGKDVYSEKPCAMTIAECAELDETVRRYGRVFQAGTQRRNVANFRHAVDLARNGNLGRIHTVHASIYHLEERHDWLPAEPEPDPQVVDWDRWLGPVPWRPYNGQYVRGEWRCHADFEARGRLLDWGAHTVDLCQWALGTDGSTPVEFEHDQGTIHARYANGVKLVLRLGGFNNEGQWHNLGTCPVRFEGDAGWVEVGDAAKILAAPASLLEGYQSDNMAGTDPTAHVRDFLNCVKSRGTTASNSVATRSSHIACHAAALSWLLSRKLSFDPATESFVGDEEANRLRRRARRAPWHA
ncbi:MAG: Gfo/Idh/MocA family oxidoreductase [Verrucomicrobia bacterium]|nr:Gfo/Idh/MocA family oxidoreductase [Verrucomicrobiota bacterium]